MAEDTVLREKLADVVASPATPWPTTTTWAAASRRQTAGGWDRRKYAPASDPNSAKRVLHDTLGEFAEAARSAKS